MCVKLYTKSIGRRRIIQGVKVKMVQSMTALCVNIWGGAIKFHLFSLSEILQRKQSTVPFELSLGGPQSQCGHFGGKKKNRLYPL
jgi:hypothetical protein